MRDIESIVKEVADIYRESGNEAEKYLRKARGLMERFGPGLAIIYCWFYSVPQKRTQVEPKIFELMRLTNSFDLDTILAMSTENFVMALKPMIFYNEISSQLKNFCKVIKDEYSSWDKFAGALSQESIFETFKKLRKYRNIRVTFKNLSAMKIFVGMKNDLLILDTHIAKVLGIDKNEASKCRVQETLFKDLLEKSRERTDELKKRGVNVCIAKWSLAIWFNKTKTLADKLLPLA
jgi:endonuclease III